MCICRSENLEIDELTCAIIVMRFALSSLTECSLITAPLLQTIGQLPLPDYQYTHAVSLLSLSPVFTTSKKKPTLSRHSSGRFTRRHVLSLFIYLTKLLFIPLDERGYHLTNDSQPHTSSQPLHVIIVPNTHQSQPDREAQRH